MVSMCCLNSSPHSIVRLVIPIKDFEVIVECVALFVGFLVTCKDKDRELSSHVPALKCKVTDLAEIRKRQ